MTDRTARISDERPWEETLRAQRNAAELVADALGAAQALEQAVTTFMNTDMEFVKELRSGQAVLAALAEFERCRAALDAHAAEAEQGECTFSMSEHWPTILAALRAAQEYADITREGVQWAVAPVEQQDAFLSRLRLADERFFAHFPSPDQEDRDGQ